MIAAETMSTSPIIHAFIHILPLNEKEIEHFIQITKEENLSKGQFWVKENKPNERIGFLVSGYLRKYYTDNYGKEITDAFYFSQDFCTDLPSIIGNTKSSSYIVAMEETSLITFSYADFDKLRTKYPTFERIYSKFLELNFLKFYNRTTSFIQQTPKERYMEMLKRNPIILQKATQYHIASYLGISYQHLSRLRSAKMIFSQMRTKFT
jgi:CRP-like cAMP-binding protein